MLKKKARSDLGLARIVAAVLKRPQSESGQSKAQTISLPLMLSPL